MRKIWVYRDFGDYKNVRVLFRSGKNGGLLKIGRMLMPLVTDPVLKTVIGIINAKGCNFTIEELVDAYKLYLDEYQLSLEARADVFFGRG